MTNSTRKLLITKLVKQETGWAIAGYENGISDGEFNEMPSNEQLANEIYNQVINSRGLEMSGGFMPIKKDIRFFTTEAIMEIINKEILNQL
jgi:hypothetical protein